MAGSSTVLYAPLPVVDAETQAKAENPTIHIPIGQQVERTLHSQDYLSLVFETLTPADFYDTYILRDPAVVATLMEGEFSVGPTIEFMSTHPLLAIAYLIGIVAVSVLAFDREYTKQQAAHKKRSSDYVMLLEWLNEEDEEEHSLAATHWGTLTSKRRYKLNLRKKIEFFNNALREIQEEDAKLGKLYHPFRIELPEVDEDNDKPVDLKNLKFAVRCKNPEEEKSTATTDTGPVKSPASQEGGFWNGLMNWVVMPVWNKILKPVWFSLLLASYAYWIAFITMASFTGAMDVGIVGLSPWLAFGIPALIALPYAALKIYHYVKNGEYKKSIKEIAQTKMAKSDLDSIVAKANRKVELQRLQRQRDRMLVQLSDATLDHKLAPLNPLPMVSGNVAGLGTAPVLQATSSFVTTVVDEKGLAQYNAWLVTDFTQIVFHVCLIVPFTNTVVGLLLLGFALARGVYEMVDRYRTVKNEKPSEEGPKHTLQNLEDAFTERKSRMIALRHDLHDQQKTLKKTTSENSIYLENPKEIPLPAHCLARMNILLTPPPPPQGFVDKTKDFLNSNMAGDFAGRLFFVAGTAIFLFFTVSTYGLGPLLAVVAIGIIHAALKTVEKNQKQQSAKAKELLTQIQNSDREIEIAQQAKENMIMQKLLLDDQIKQKKALGSDENDLDSSSCAADSDMRRNDSITSINSITTVTSSPNVSPQGGDRAGDFVGRTRSGAIRTVASEPNIPILEEGAKPLPLKRAESDGHVPAENEDGYVPQQNYYVGIV